MALHPQIREQIEGLAEAEEAEIRRHYHNTIYIECKHLGVELSEGDKALIENHFLEKGLQQGTHPKRFAEMIQASMRSES